MKPIYIAIFTLLFFSCKQTPLKQVITEQESKITETDNTPGFAIYKQLQGTWVNIEAPISSLTFADNKVINKHDGVAVKKNILFSIQNSCGATAAGETPEERDKYIVTSGDTAECYYIVQLDDENLILGFWGEETALRFKKATNY
ncbi:MAG: hypothetical protein ACJAYD_000979 [Patiriisocius sp.]|jgi:hypothetical protein